MKRSALIYTHLVLCLIFSSEILLAQTLSRRVFLGIRMETLSPETSRIMNIPDAQGVLISEVFPGSTAASAGWKRGDVLCKLGNRKTSNIEETLAALAGQKSGSGFTFELIRDKQLISGEGTFSAFPTESYADIEMEYSASSTEEGPQRIILSKPALSAGKKPLIAFIGGIGCYSLDTPFDTSRSEVQLLNHLTRSGFICARLEKPGIGDNAGHSTPCQSLGMKEEAATYVASIRELKKRPDVDSNAVYIIGHSMGGVFAPLVSQQTAINGIVAYGTIGSNFIEYLAKTRRTIAEALNMNPVETDNFIREFCACSAYYFIEKMSTEQAAVKNPACRNYLSVFDRRSRTYNDELYAFNFPQLWQAYSGNVLLLWGENDYVASREDHEILQKTIRHFRKAEVEFKVVSQADHGMHISSSFAEAHSDPGPYQDNVSQIVLQWLQKVRS